jgi:hypothetical protein
VIHFHNFDRWEPYFVPEINQSYQRRVCKVCGFIQTAYLGNGKQPPLLSPYTPPQIKP